MSITHKQLKSADCSTSGTVGVQRRCADPRCSRLLCASGGLRSDCRGFSLLELMAVMLLMLIMMGIATTAFRGIMRGAGIRGASATVRGVLSQARQQAMNNGQPVAVIISEPGTMRSVMSFGRVIDTDGNVIKTENELPWTASQISGAKVYHFGSSESGTISAEGVPPDSRVEFRVNDLNMGVGDEVAFELGTLRELPSSLVFSLGGSGSLTIVFHADGSAESSYDLDVEELSGSAGFSVAVNAMTGGISVSDFGE